MILMASEEQEWREGPGQHVERIAASYAMTRPTQCPAILTIPTILPIPTIPTPWPCPATVDWLLFWVLTQPEEATVEICISKTARTASLLCVCVCNVLLQDLWLCQRLYEFMNII